ncbi:hypothetical protein O3P69_020256 [Scylla paramamosain]|uniref:PiggyBac transposable element-derived protein domain-containing protein n=1 Tax=Scylla paramamosain TaxID=85552 RepID=A0AAW0TKH3_SCYPA
MKNHKLYFDNWFTSVPLIEHVASRGIWCSGTVQARRLKGLTFKSDNLQLKVLGRGIRGPIAYSEEVVVLPRGSSRGADFWNMRVLRVGGIAVRRRDGVAVGVVKEYIMMQWDDGVRERLGQVGSGVNRCQSEASQPAHTEAVRLGPLRKAGNRWLTWLGRLALAPVDTATHRAEAFPVTAQTSTMFHNI